VATPTQSKTKAPSAALPHNKERQALRAIAVFEAIKGSVALLLGFGVLSLLHRDLHELAQQLISHIGLDPGQRYPAAFLHYADVLQDTNRRTLVLLMVGYVGIRFAEAYGLWFERTWGEWLAALAGALYVPFEIRHLLHKHSWFSAFVLLANLAMVAFLVWELWKKRQAKVRAKIAALA
jgi:uncharacterized membrane protein (DUF2068 family)